MYISQMCVFLSGRQFELTGSRNNHINHHIITLKYIWTSDGIIKRWLIPIKFDVGRRCNLVDNNDAHIHHTGFMVDDWATQYLEGVIK